MEGVTSHSGKPAAGSLALRRRANKKEGKELGKPVGRSEAEEGAEQVG